jgi:carboxyl-terminal processing protease
VKPFTIRIDRLDGRPPTDRRHRRALRAGVILSAWALVFTAGVGAGAGLDRAGFFGWAAPTVSVGAAEFGLIREAWELIEGNYVGARDLDERDLAHGAIRGMTEAVGDTGHTDFMDPDERKARGDALSGRFVGIGISLVSEDDRALIEEVFAGGSAADAGLRPGDEIVAVDGDPVDEAVTTDIVGMIRGPEGTSVTVTVVRPGGERIEVRLTRAAVEVPAVAWTMVPGTTIADVALRRFQTGAADELADALAEAGRAGATGVVLDLRGNPGGYTGEAVGVASQFLERGVVYTTEDASGTVTEVSVDAARSTITLPVVVLVDGESASSAEIVAGALRDHRRATVVGEVTLGTGTVIGEYPLSDGSALRIGSVNWRTPNGTLIWHEGITPDEVVPLPEDARPVRPGSLASLQPDEVGASGDSQLIRALEILAADD